MFRLSALLILAIFCSILAHIYAAGTFNCAAIDTALRTTVCQNDIWPKTSVVSDVTIKSSTRTLVVRRVTVYSNDFRSVPALPELTELNLQSISTRDAHDQVVDFPLTQFMSKLTRNLLLDLSLENVRLNVISEAKFEGLTSLKALSFTGCNLTSIDPKSFYAVATPVPGLEFQYNGRLESLYFEAENELTGFGWETLFPVAKSLKQVTFSGASKLAALNHRPSNELPRMVMGQLSNIYMYGTKLRTIPKNVIDTFAAVAGPLQIEFRGGENQCGSCDLVDLISWTNTRNRCENNVFLSATCINGQGDPVSSGALIIPSNCPVPPPSSTTPAACPATTAPPPVSSPTPGTDHDNSAGSLSSCAVYISVILVAVLY